MSDQAQSQELAESYLQELIASNPEDWESRKKLAQLLYNEGKTKQAAEIIWDAPEIPSIDLELGFAAKVLGKGAPQKAIRLLSSLQELNKGKPVQNLAIANALLHYGMVMQAARFYGAAFADDPSLVNPDLEHFLLWVDDKEKIWGDFKQDKPNLAELPWIKRDAKEAELLKMALQGHTTPVKIPNLAAVTAETVIHDMYSQASQLNVQSTPSTVRYHSDGPRQPEGCDHRRTTRGRTTSGPRPAGTGCTAYRTEHRPELASLNTHLQPPHH